jgi:hypothetical protein
MVDEALCLFHSDVDKEIYEIENEITYVTKWQVIAKNRDEAFDIWLDQHKLNMSTEDSKNTVCSYVKDYSQMGAIKKIAKIKYNEESDEIYADES